MIESVPEWTFVRLVEGKPSSGYVGIVLKNAIGTEFTAGGIKVAEAEKLVEALKRYIRSRVGQAACCASEWISSLGSA